MAQWITAWAQAHADMSMLCKDKKNYTSRLSIFSALSGEQVRLKLSNTEGKTAVTLEGVSIQKEDGVPVVLTFDGKQKLRLEPGESVYSDSAEAGITAGEVITVSLAFGEGATSGNILPECVRLSTEGNYTRQREMPMEKPDPMMISNGLNPVLPVLSSIEIYTEEKPRVVVCFGDSLTQMSRWTRPLADRLQDAGANAVVINKGIGGNKLLSDPEGQWTEMFGRAGVKRFEEDVMEVAGASDLVIAMGVNDFNAVKDEADARGKADAIVNTYHELASRARHAGMKVYVATVTPSAGCEGYQSLSEPERRKLNDEVRNSEEFDGVLDFDAAVRDSQNPAVMKEYCDSGDHVHPGTVGGKKMAQVAYEVLFGRFQN